MNDPEPTGPQYVTWHKWIDTPVDEIKYAAGRVVEIWPADDRWLGPEVELTESIFVNPSDEVIAKYSQMIDEHLAKLPNPMWSVTGGSHWGYTSGNSEDDYHTSSYYGEESYNPCVVMGPMTVVSPYETPTQTTKYDRRYVKKLAKRCVSKLGPILWRVRKLVTSHELKYIERNHNNLRFWCGYPNGTVKDQGDGYWRIEYGSVIPD